MSNFRPVKRLDSVVEVFRRCGRRDRGSPATDRRWSGTPRVEQMAVNYGLTNDVIFTGEQQDPVRWLSVVGPVLAPVGAGELRTRCARSHGV